MQNILEMHGSLCSQPVPIHQVQAMTLTWDTTILPSKQQAQPGEHNAPSAAVWFHGATAQAKHARCTKHRGTSPCPLSHPVFRNSNTSTSSPFSHYKQILTAAIRDAQCNCSEIQRIVHRLLSAIVQSNASGTNSRRHSAVIEEGSTEECMQVRHALSSTALSSTALSSCPRALLEAQ